MRRQRSAISRRSRFRWRAPFVVGFAWLLANCRARLDSAEEHVFACIGASTVVLVVLEVTKYDLGLGGTLVFDRYLFYLAPVVLLAFSCAVLDRAWPRWSLLVPEPYSSASASHFARRCPSSSRAGR